MLEYETLLDASRRWFTHVASSPNYTREARELALKKQREVAAELDAANGKVPFRRLIIVRDQLPKVA